jgi:hypothetical protein
MVDASRRCDHCGVQAYWSCWIDMIELAYCNHFFRKHETALREQSMTVIDHTWEMEA